MKGLKCQARELNFHPEAGKAGAAYAAYLALFVPAFSVPRLTGHAFST